MCARGGVVVCRCEWGNAAAIEVVVLLRVIHLYPPRTKKTGALERKVQQSAKLLDFIHRVV